MFEFLTDVKKVKSLTEQDIRLLIDSKVSENLQLDYKLKLSWDTDKDKTEFLKDISSFYNSQGGVILYGLQEVKSSGSNTGIPQLPVPPVTGLVIKKSLDQTKLDILSCIRTGINPPVNTVYFSELLEVSGHQILGLGIPKNNSLPAMVTKNEVNSFYRRNHSQKYPMDTMELYNTFLRHNTERKEVEDFVDKRLEQVHSPYFLEHKVAPKAVYHLIHTDYTQNVALDTFFEPDFRSFAQLHFDSNAYDVRRQYAFGFEGLYLLAKLNRTEYNDYSDGTLVFRNGIIETFISTVFSDNPSNWIYNGTLWITNLMDSLVRSIEGAFAYYERAGISPGFYLSLILDTPGTVSAVGVNGKALGQIKNDQLRFPLFLVTGPTEVDNVLGLILDILCQAAGVDQSPPELKQKVVGHFKLS